MPKLFYGSSDVNGVRINYYRTGDDKPPVILLHGHTDAALAWNRLPVALEPEFDVVLIDARGHGYSASPESGYSPQEQAADVLALIEKLALNRPSLVGHSMGAVVAAIVAAEAPQQVRGLVLEDPPWPQPADEAERARLAARWQDQIQARKQLTFDQLEELCAAEHPGWHESERFQWVKARQLVNPRTVEYFTAPWPGWQETLSKVQAPGLLVVGEPELGSVTGPEVVQWAEQAWKRGQVVRIPGAGHQIHREQYRPYLDAVRRFLRKVSY